jgi:hypothetical protein
MEMSYEFSKTDGGHDWTLKAEVGAALLELD